MTNDFPGNREANLKLLRAAKRQFEDVRGAMRATVKRLKAGSDDTVPTAQIMAFHKALQTVIDIETNLAKRSQDISGGDGACALDLDDARREIVERLTKIAESRRTDNVS